METKEKLEAELTRLRADAQQEREQLLADVKQQADDYREQARRALDEATQRRIQVLEQLMGVYRDLDGVPAALESAYHELKNPPEESESASGLLNFNMANRAFQHCRWNPYNIANGNFNMAELCTPITL